MADVEGRIVTGRRLPGASRKADAADAFRILVLGNFSGDRADRVPLRLRRPMRVDLDSFEAAFTQLAPRLQLAIAGEAESAVEVDFASLEAFEPDAVFSRVALFARMREWRRQLGNADTFRQAAAEIQGLSAAPATERPAEDDAALLERLLGRPPAGGRAAASLAPSPPETPVDRLSRAAVAPYIVPATAHLQQPLIAALDQAIAASMRSLLRQPKWRDLEGCWRAVDSFLRRVETDAGVVLELFDVRPGELLEDFIQAAGVPARTALGSVLGNARAADARGDGWALIVGFDEFGPSAPEVALLAGLAATAADAGSVYLGAASPGLIDLAGHSEPGAAAQPDSADAQRWGSLRESRFAAQVGLVWPRLLSRLPYGARSQPVESFDFDELGDSCSAERLPWRTAALDAAALLAGAFIEAGWSMRPDEYLDIEELPAWIDPDDGSASAQVAEVSLGERDTRRLQAHGVMPLTSHRSLPQARLAGWQSIAADGAPLAGRWQRSDRSNPEVD